ncbi:hypothetical protein [Pseudonocardia sp. ICBG1034]|uniref:hypothetical protein n=1 Tax=Pseudonocardia sp. ICBG1034 TaxID=2844381 RepID=UPI001CCC0710|nr:hypothetical protein [Pseudonocardia sp. ICBG1034]
MRFHPAPVVRLADARPMHLGHVARADGAWRLYAFADRTHPADPEFRCECCTSPSSPGLPLRGPSRTRLSRSAPSCNRVTVRSPHTVIITARRRSASHYTPRLPLQ